MFNLKKKSLFNKTAVSLEVGTNATSEVIAYPDQVFLIHTGHHVHNTDLQLIFGIVETASWSPSRQYPRHSSLADLNQNG